MAFNRSLHDQAGSHEAAHPPPLCAAPRHLGCRMCGPGRDASGITPESKRGSPQVISPSRAVVFKSQNRACAVLKGFTPSTTLAWYAQTSAVGGSASLGGPLAATSSGSEVGTEGYEEGWRFVSNPCLGVEQEPSRSGWVSRTFAIAGP